LFQAAFYVSGCACMKKSFLLLICLIANTLMFAQNKADTVEYYMNSKWEKCGELFATYFRLAYKDGDTWCVKDYYLSTRTIQMKGYFSEYKKDDFKTENGMFYYYHPNGILEGKQRYVNGKREGVFKWYDNTGKITDSAYYKNGMPCKFAFRWEDGILIGRSAFNDTGSGAGEVWVYYKNGTLSDYERFCEGYKKDSVSLHYYPNGKLSCKEYYNCGKELKHECFDTNGVLTGYNCLYTGIEPVSKREFRKAIQNIKDKLVYGSPPEIKDMIKNKQVRGVILLQLCVDTTGKLTVKVLKGLNGKLDKYICDMLSQLPKLKPEIIYNRLHDSCEEFEILI